VGRRWRGGMVAPQFGGGRQATPNISRSQIPSIIPGNTLKGAYRFKGTARRPLSTSLASITGACRGSRSGWAAGPRRVAGNRLDTVQQVVGERKEQSGSTLRDAIAPVWVLAAHPQRRALLHSMVAV
jgi:hypothetical protein